MTRPERSRRIVRIRAFAKINLTLQIRGVRSDGYHELRTTFQSIGIGDALTISETRKALEVTCDDPACPDGSANIVWHAASRLWEATARSGEVRGLRIHIEKRIPMEAGLGGGSADAAAAMRALAAIWSIRDEALLRSTGAELGADVPFFLEGGTALGCGRGDVIIRLPDVERRWVVVAVPRFGVRTRDAYKWFDDQSQGASARPGTVDGNDLEPPVIARHPEIGRLVALLKRAGGHAAMSGSGSAVFGLFPTRSAADGAADSVIGAGGKGPIIYVTRTLSRAEHRRLARPELARK